jgi:hypothetical protein
MRFFLDLLPSLALYLTCCFSIACSFFSVLYHPLFASEPSFPHSLLFNRSLAHSFSFPLLQAGMANPSRFGCTSCMGWAASSNAKYAGIRYGVVWWCVVVCVGVCWCVLVCSDVCWCVLMYLCFNAIRCSLARSADRSSSFLTSHFSPRFTSHHISSLPITTPFSRRTLTFVNQIPL